MPTKANFTKVVFYPNPRGNSSAGNSNLLGVNGKTEYNGFMSEATKKHIRKLVANYANTIHHAKKTLQQQSKKQANTDGQSISNEQSTNKEKVKDRNIISNNKKSINWERNKNVLETKLSFLTLTLPTKQKNDDKEIKRQCLNSFMIKIVKDCNIKVWLWVAELQKNGNIHFHILIDSYVPFVVIDIDNNILFVGTKNKCDNFATNNVSKKYKSISYAQYVWNNALEKLGYITDFCQKFGHNQPPTTHIEIIKQAKTAAAYITKYITKNNSNMAKSIRKIEGRLWGCSDGLRLFEDVVIPMELRNTVYKEIVSKGNLLVDEEYVKVYIVDVSSISQLYEYILDNYISLILEVYDNCTFESEDIIKEFSG